jgi:hypothetical protein
MNPFLNARDRFAEPIGVWQRAEEAEQVRGPQTLAAVEGDRLELPAITV